MCDEFKRSEARHVGATRSSVDDECPHVFRVEINAVREGGKGSGSDFKIDFIDGSCWRGKEKERERETERASKIAATFRLL